MNKETTVKVLNEWIRRYIDEPERFENEMTTLKEFLADEAAGKEPSYDAVPKKVAPKTPPNTDDD